MNERADDFSGRTVVVACASFKGTLSSREAGESVARGLRSALPGIGIRIVPLADGGEGLVYALASRVEGSRLLDARCRDPLGRPRFARFAVLPPGPERARTTAVLEMAASSGLTLLSAAERDPKVTTTLGVGDQILAALDELRGTDAEILLGIGGSATNDGGAGMAVALGARFLDAADRLLEPGGLDLLRLSRIEVGGLDPRVANVLIRVACDVRNPLLGPQGASFVYGPQKGATPEDCTLLDRALARFAEIVKRDLRRNVADVPSAGAAGGLGAGCLAFLGATLIPGIELVLDAVGFDSLLQGASFVVTGEGRLDRTTVLGKAPSGVAKRAHRAGIPCIAISGSIEDSGKAALQPLFDDIDSLEMAAGSLEAALREPTRWIEEVVRRKAPSWAVMSSFPLRQVQKKEQT